MIIKKYIAHNIDEIQDIINLEMGPNAVILTSRQIRYKGWRALFFQNKVEVVAAIEEEDYQTYQRLQQDRNQQALREIEKNWGQAIEKLQELKQTLSAENSLSPSQTESLKEPFEFSLQPIERKLIAIGIPLQIASEIANEVQSPDDLGAIKAALTARIAESGPIPLTSPLPTPVVFIGLPKSGTTSLLFKVASQYEKVGKRVGIVTLGSPSENAQSKLESLAQEFNFSFWKCTSSIQDFLHQDCDLLFIDVDASNPFLAEDLKHIPNLQAHLVVEANCEDLESLEYLRTLLTYQGVAITKLDQCSYPGNILSLMQALQLPISYLAGSNLPTGLEIATSSHLADLILKPLSPASSL